jgi:hypothetical protein
MSEKKGHAKRFWHLFRGQLVTKLVIVGEPGVSKTCTTAALYRHLDSAQRGPSTGQVRIGAVDHSIVKATHRIGRGKFPCKTPSGAVEVFDIESREFGRLRVVNTAGEFLGTNNGGLDPEATLKLLRGSLLVVVLNSFALDEATARKAIKGLSSTFQRPPLRHGDLAAAVAAAMYTLYGIDVADEPDATNGQRSKRDEAIRLVRNVLTVLARFDNVLINPIEGGRGVEFVRVTGDTIAPVDADTHGILDNQFASLAQIAVAESRHAPLVNRLVQDVEDVIVCLSHADLLAHTPGLSAGDVFQAFDARFGERHWLREQVMLVSNLEIFLQPRGQKHPTRLRGFDLSGAPALWRSICLALRNRRWAWPWPVALTLTPVVLSLMLLAALLAAPLLSLSAATALLWLGWAGLAAGAVGAAEFLRRNGTRLYDRMSDPAVFPEPNSTPPLEDNEPNEPEPAVDRVPLPKAPRNGRGRAGARR